MYIKFKIKTKDKGKYINKTCLYHVQFKQYEKYIIVS